MKNYIDINNKPNADEVWQGIGGHFDTLGQIINEFLDNSISNLLANNCKLKKIDIFLEEQEDESIIVMIRDTGTGIENLDFAFTLGSKDGAETPFNEHGFGLKHAFASANPDNNNWDVYTVTKEDLLNGTCKHISAPYRIDNFRAEIIDVDECPVKIFETGTVVRFHASKDMFRTLSNGLKGNFNKFETLVDILCEDIGFTYAEIIENKQVEFSLNLKWKDGTEEKYSIDAVTPNWDDIHESNQGLVEYDLGGGSVKINYKFGIMNQKPDRIAFDNTTTRKYYKQNMSSSGAEIQINGRVICHNIFKEIWNIEKHNSYNSYLLIINLESIDLSSLPKTRTSKNGFRQGDEKLESLYSWIKTYLDAPIKDKTNNQNGISESQEIQELELFNTLEQKLKKKSEDQSKINENDLILKIEREKPVFLKILKPEDCVKADLYYATRRDRVLIEGKKAVTEPLDVFQLFMYCLGMICDGVKITKAVLIGASHTQGVKNIVEFINQMKDPNGNYFNFECKTWDDYGIQIEK